jgi:hypothetical protein
MMIAKLSETSKQYSQHLPQYLHLISLEYCLLVGKLQNGRAISITRTELKIIINKFAALQT